MSNISALHRIFINFDIISGLTAYLSTSDLTTLSLIHSCFHEPTRKRLFRNIKIHKKDLTQLCNNEIVKYIIKLEVVVPNGTKTWDTTTELFWQSLTNLQEFSIRTGKSYYDSNLQAQLIIPYDRLMSLKSLNGVRIADALPKKNGQ
ncbi:hypothetical protein BKA69DRAFT_1040746 [Paraphysoderma sedebokerense]|nr:hypothetical protein BKA69DRAFT_1040746 [Paraphysoderma sedebokerense]